MLTPFTIGQRIAADHGFSLVELLVSTAVLLIITGAVTGGLLQMSNSQRVIANRTELHAGVRSATELLQQEVGQAGRVALPGTATLDAAVAVGAQTVKIDMVINGSTCNSNGARVGCVASIFPNEWLSVDGGVNKESVQVTSVNTGATQITATFTLAHAAGASVNVLGGFGSGIVPDQYYDTASSSWKPYPNGSDGTHLKLFGDVNGDGNMVYVEYWCDNDTANGGSGNLYRTTLAYDSAAGAKVKPTANQVLLSNLTINAVNPQTGVSPACFTYLPSPEYYLTTVTDPGCSCTQTFVLDVAVTLTVNTQQINPITRKVETETKALLNVSPRNVFDVWQLASVNLSANNDRVQPMPPTVINLLPSGW